MESVELSEELKKVILDCLNLEGYPIEASMQANEVLGWDSLKHLEIIGLVEEAFEVRFQAYEIANLANLGELQALVDQKRSEQT